VATEALGKVVTVNEVSLLQLLLWDENKAVWKRAVNALKTILNKSFRIKIIINNASADFRPSVNYQPYLQHWNILHISDLYYTDDKKYEFSILFDDLIDKLEKWRRRENKKIDMICITGDLVWSGEESQYLEMFPAFVFNNIIVRHSVE
jgi:predicted MPP superfamily phosphohydrolase